MKGKKEPQQIKLFIDDRGDMSVGIFPEYEEVTISFKYGGIDEEWFKETAKALKETLQECYDTRRVFLEDEWKKEIEGIIKDY
jgi:hypothetical protein